MFSSSTKSLTKGMYTLVKMSLRLTGLLALMNGVVLMDLMLLSLSIKFFEFEFSLSFSRLLSLAHSLTAEASFYRPC